MHQSKSREQNLFPNTAEDELQQKLAAQKARIPKIPKRRVKSAKRELLAADTAATVPAVRDKAANANQVQRAGPLKLLDIMPYRGVHQRVAEKEGATVKPINLSVNTQSSYGTIAALNKANHGQGFTTTRGAHLTLKPMDHCGAIYAEVKRSTPKRFADKVSITKQEVTAQDARDMFMHVLQTGVNELEVHLPQELGFLLAFVNVFDKHSTAVRVLDITYAPAGQLPQVISVRGQGGGAGYAPKAALTQEMKVAFKKEEQWLKDQLNPEQPGPYADLLQKVDAAWCHNIQRRLEMATRHRKASFKPLQPSLRETQEIPAPEKDAQSEQAGKQGVPRVLFQSAGSGQRLALFSVPSKKPTITDTNIRQPKIDAAGLRALFEQKNAR